LESITIFSTTVGSSSESPIGDSSSDSLVLRAFEDFPLYARGIVFGFLAGSCSLKPIS